MFLSAEADIGPFFSVFGVAKLVEGLYTAFKKVQMRYKKTPDWGQGKYYVAFLFFSLSEE
jgi:hypothetical protein